MLVLGGAVYHPGGLEAFCARAAEAVTAADRGWVADWSPTDAAYLNPLRMVGLGRRLAALLDAKQRGIDVIWLQWSTLADLLFVLEARALGIPVLVTPHLGQNARLQRVGSLRRLCAGTLRAANRIGMLFDRQGEEIALPAGVPTSVLRTFLPAASLARALPPKAPGPIRLIHAGRLSEGKGTFRMVDLCAELRARRIPFSARIVGRADAPTIAALQSKIGAAGIADAVEVIEWLDEKALMEALVAADVLVHLSTLDSFPLIVLEAMAAGAVPIVGEMAGARSMVEAYDGHVAEGSTAIDAANWLAARSVEELRQRGAYMAAQVRSDYRWERSAELAIAAAETTLTQHGSRNAR